ncbi:EamA family transporter [Fusobacterium necrophorum]
MLRIFFGASYYKFSIFSIFYNFFLCLKKKILPIQAKDLWYSFILSILLFFVFLTMTVGLKYTTASNAGFLVSLSVIFIPFFSMDNQWRKA